MGAFRWSKDPIPSDSLLDNNYTSLRVARTGVPAPAAERPYFFRHPSSSASPHRERIPTDRQQLYQYKRKKDAYPLHHHTSNRPTKSHNKKQQTHEIRIYPHPYLSRIIINDKPQCLDTLIHTYHIDSAQYNITRIEKLPAPSTHVSYHYLDQKHTHTHIAHRTWNRKARVTMKEP